MVEDVSALHVGKALLLRELARPGQQVEGGAQLAEVHAGPAFGQTRAELELLSLRGVLQGGESFKRLVEPLAFDRRFGADHGRLGLRVFVPALPRLEIRDVDPKPLGNPRERFLGRTRLAALDLADVLLREPIARQLRLGQTGGNAQLA